MKIMPDVGVYRTNGGGRDTYISFNNGNNFCGYQPDKQPIRGTIGFGEKLPMKQFGPKTASVEGKRVGIYPNGTGRDSYVT